VRSAGSGTAALSLLLIVSGCGGGDGGSDPADSGIPRVDAPEIEPMAELGTGEIEFAPISEGQELQFIRGPQGGFHFLGSVRVKGIDPGNPEDRRDPGNPTTEFRVFRGDERVDLMASMYTQGIDPVPGGDGTEFQMVGRLVILDIETCEDLDGDTVRVEVSVEDAHGTRVTDERTVVAVPHPFNS